MPRSRRKRGDLHGNAPDESRVALLVIDMINAFDFEGAKAMLPRALGAARAIAALKRRARKAGVPAVYVNILAHCLRSPGRDIARLLRPGKDDYFVLKPKHSGFQFTTLDVLLGHLGAETLILTGVAGDFCVLFTAHDAYMRDFRLVVPRDCVASLSESDDRYALAHMGRVTKADVRASRELGLEILVDQVGEAQ